MIVRQLVAFSLAASGFLFGDAWAATTKSSDGEPAAGKVESCERCHRYQVGVLTHNPHSALDTKGLSDLNGATSSCSACHGESQLSLDSPDSMSRVAIDQGCLATFAFGENDPPAAKAHRCLTCHSRDLPESSMLHAGMDCTNCHQICQPIGQRQTQWPLQRAVTQYASSVQHEAPWAICGECHGEILTYFELAESHRLKEGFLECISCHDPHAPQSRMMLGGFKKEVCVGCHAANDGPFVFEHPSLRVDGCLACHSQHGSQNRHLLLYQSVAELCFSCHALVPGFHSRFTLDTVCTNCHATIHGSNLDPMFLR